MLEVKKDFANALEIFNQQYETAYLYIEEFDSLYYGGENEEDLICSLVDLKKILISDESIVLDFDDDCNVYLFPDGFEFEGDSPRSSMKQVI